MLEFGRYAIEQLKTITYSQFSIIFTCRITYFIWKMCTVCIRNKKKSKLDNEVVSEINVITTWERPNFKGLVMKCCG